MTDDLKKSMVSKGRDTVLGLTAMGAIWMYSEFPSKETNSLQIQNAQAAMQVQMVEKISESEKRIDEKHTAQMVIMNDRLDNMMKLLVEIKLRR